MSAGYPHTMATRTGFGLQPKKKMITYGKVARRNGTSSSFEAFRKEESSASLARLSKSASQPSSPPEAGPSLQRSMSDQAVAQDRGSDHSGRAQHPRGRPALKLPVTTQIDQEGGLVKKRKLAEPSSATPDPYADIYSPPSSPSPPRVSSPKRIARPFQTKASAGQTPSIRVDQVDVGWSNDPCEATAPFSVETSKRLTKMNINNNNAPPQAQQAIPLRLNRSEAGRSSGVAPKTNSEPSRAKAKEPETSAPTRRRKRLIDALVAQVEESPEEEEESSQEIEMTPFNASPDPVLRSSPAPTLPEHTQAKIVARQIAMTKKPGPKFTYSQERTMLAEDPLFEAAGLANSEEGFGGASLLGLGSLMKSSTVCSFSFIDEEDETANTGAVRSLHELRQAGANSRFSDEMDDMLDRIGAPSQKPSSLRRGALFELAQKMQDKSFRRQFRSHSGDAGLFKLLAEETDTITGYAIVSILTTLLATSPSQHLIQQLQSEGIGQLLLRLLEETSDITAIAKDRKCNVSRHGQSTLSIIKAAILQLSVWEPIHPTVLSPRTLALKALDLIMRQLTGPARDTPIFSPEITDKLFLILSNFASPTCWEFPAHPESVDFYLALYVLEHHSVSAMQSTLGSRWTSQYLPIVADVLETALQRPADKFDDLESLALRLTLNTTNNNPKGPSMFVNRGLLRDLAETICRTFDVVLKSIMDDSFLSKVLESLIFMLGVGINFCEHYPPAAQNLCDIGDGETSPLNRLIRVFLDYHSTTSDADSMEKTQLNVAFGYLSIVLGYLCLHQPVREKFTTIHSKKNLEPLLESIREFILFHKLAANAMEEELGPIPESNAADRLQGLVDQLQSAY